MKKGFSLILIMCILISLFTAFPIVVNANDYVWDGTRDTTWYNEEEDEFAIDTPEKFAGFASLVNSGNTFEGKTIILTQDIDLNNYGWQPIGYTSAGKYGITAQYFFSGIFKGMGHTISGLHINNKTGEFKGLFGNVNGQIDGIVLDDSEIRALYCIGGIAFSLWDTGIISNCVNNATIEVYGGSSTYSPGTGGEAGGIVGSSDGIIKNCVNNGSITMNNTSGYVRGHVGGIVGDLNEGEVRNCVNNGSITTYSSRLVGGISGQADYGSVISQCYNTGNISVNGHPGIYNSYAGGIVGNATAYSSTNGLKIDQCYNLGEIFGSYDCIGGIAGSVQSYGYASITNCHNVGKVSGRNYVGGLVGNMNSWNSGSFLLMENCYSIGECSGNESLGAIVGGCGAAYNGAARINNCFCIDGSGVYGVGKEGTDVEVNFYTKTIEQMITNDFCNNLNTTNGIDENSTFWGINSEINMGYPYLINCGNKNEGQHSYPNSITGEFRFASGKGKAQFKYHDNYFSESSYIYNHELSKMSMRLALSAFAKHGSEDKYSNQYANVQDLMTKMQFHDFYKNEWYKTEPTADSIGVAIGRKGVKYSDDDFTILAVVIRGGNYENEWGGNFNVGNDKNHIGFETARNQVLECLNEYQKTYNVTGKVKIWITGYSRAAATANLTAAYLDAYSDAFNWGFEFAPSDVYAYCFETPAPTTEKTRNSELYNNIFNIVNQHDFVPMVAMRKWGYGRFGITKYLPSAYTHSNYSELKSRMLEYYDEYQDEKYIVDDFVYYILTSNSETLTKQGMYNQGVFLENIIDKLATNIKSAENYENEFQELFKYIGEEVVGKGNVTSLTTKIKSEFSDRSILLVTDGIMMMNPTMSWIGAGSAYLSVRAAIKDAFEELNIEITNSAVDTIAKLILDVGIEKIYTLLENADGIKQGHFPELCMAWLDAIDGEDFTNKRLRTLYLNCPIDFEMYDSSNNLVAAVYNNVPQDIEDSTIIVSIDENGQKIVYLPQDEEYRIEIVATDDGEVTYSVQEQDITTGFTKVINYNNMVVSKNNTITGVAENLKVTENAMYPLTSNTVDVGDAEKIESAEPINVTINAEGNGGTQGGGTFYKGEYAQAIATPVENEEFLGWYEGDSLVSTDSTYRFQVVNDITLTAKFTENTCEIIFLDDDDYVISTKRIVKGNTVTIPDVPEKDGYRFVGFYTDKEYTTAIATDDVYTEDTALYAKYEAPSAYNGFQYYINGDTIEIVGYRYSSYELRVPISINGLAVTKIADEAFMNSQLESILIPDTVTIIGVKAFDGCEYLETINYIGTEEQWNAINIGENNDVLNNAEKVFEYSENIVYGGFYNVRFTGTSIETPLGFDYIYKDCVAVVEIRDYYNELEKTVEIDISKGTEIKEISIPFDADDERHYISVSFVNNSTDKTIIGNSVRTYFYAEKVRYTDGDYTYSVIGNDAEILAYTGESTDVIIPTSLGGYSVTRIWNYAFRNSEITSVKIPNSITFIGDYVFDGCYNLSNIIVEENNANYCSVDGNLYSKDKAQLIKYAIGKTSTEWTIPNSVTTIKSGALSNSEYLENITIPDGVKVIEDYAFAYGMWETIDIPASVTDIASSAFAFCSNLKAINIDDGNINYSSENGVFLNKDKTILIQYPTGKTDSSYKLPVSVETISAESFVGAKIQTIYIPKSLKNVERYAFENCEYLNTVFYEGTEEEYWNINFAGNYVLQYADITFGYDGMPASIKSVNCWYDNNKVTAKIKFNYLEQAGTLYLAIYDEGRLVDIKDKPVAIDEMENTIEIVDADENYKDYDVKVLYWDGNSSLKPLSKFVETEIVEAVLVDDVLESEHPYANGTDETKTFVYDGECISIDVTFSDDTETESGWDYIYIYDANGNEVGKYSGTELAGQTIPVPGNAVKIRLTSDGSVNKNGYRTESIVVNK